MFIPNIWGQDAWPAVASPQGTIGAYAYINGSNKTLLCNDIDPVNRQTPQTAGSGQTLMPINQKVDIEIMAEMNTFDGSGNGNSDGSYGMWINGVEKMKGTGIKFMKIESGFMWNTQIHSMNVGGSPFEAPENTSIQLGPITVSRTPITHSTTITYHVNASSPVSSDGNPGTAAFPLSTVQRGLDLAQAGDRVHASAEAYNEVLNFPRSGGTGALIHLSCDPGAILDGTGFVDTSIVTIRNKSYIKITDWEIQNSDDMGIAILTTDNTANSCADIIVEDTHIHDIKNSGIWKEYDKTLPAWNYFRRNRIHDVGLGCITVQECYSGYIEATDNICYAWNGAVGAVTNYDAIQVGDCDHSIVRRNTVYDGGYGFAASDFIDMGGELAVFEAHHYLMENNVCYHTNPAQTGTPTGSMKINARPHHSIARGNIGYGVNMAFYEQPHTSVAVYNNTVVYTGDKHEFFLWNASSGINPGTDFGGIDVFNNIVGYGLGMAHQDNAENGDFSAIAMDNNMYCVSNPFYWNDSDTGLVSTYNVQTSSAEYERWRTELGQEPNGNGLRETGAITAVFEDHANLDFTLKAGNQGIGAAKPISTAVGSGSNSNLLTVVNSSRFFDGYPLGNKRLSDGDLITVGGAMARILSINETTHEMTLDTPISWSANDPVNLSGRSSNMGAV